MKEIFDELDEQGGRDGFLYEEKVGELLERCVVHGHVAYNALNNKETLHLKHS